MLMPNASGPEACYTPKGHSCSDILKHPGFSVLTDRLWEVTPTIAAGRAAVHGRLTADPESNHYRIREGDISDISDRVAQAVLTAFYNLRAGASNFESGASNFAPNVVSWTEGANRQNKPGNRA